MYTLNAALLPPEGKISDGKRVVSCHNLRPTQSVKGLCLEPAPLPAEAYSGGWLPFAEVLLEDKTSVTVCRLDNRLAIISKGIVISEFTLDGEPQCCLPTLGSLTVMTTAACYSLKVTAATISGSKNTPLPSPRLYTTEFSGLSADLGAITLSRQYELRSEPALDDLGIITRTMNNLYKTLDARARAAGIWWQPVLAYTVLRDSFGNVLSVSPPTVLTHPSGEYFNGTIELQSDDRKTTLARTVDVPAWQIRLDLPENAAEAYADVASIEVMASPTMHIVDVDCLWNLVIRRRATDPYFCLAKCMLASTGCTHYTIHNVMAQVETDCRNIKTISKTSLDTQSFIVDNPVSGDAVADIKLLEATAKKPVVARDYYRNLMRAPHTFTARHVANSGTSTLWADIAAAPFKGYGADTYSTVKGYGSWQATTKIEFADGHSVVSTSRGTDGTPLKFGPVLSYPSPDAVSITLTVNSGGTTFSDTFPLEPNYSGTHSLYISPDLKPFALTTQLDTFTTPEENPPVRQLPDYVAAAPTTAPLQTSAAICLPGHDINALAPAFSAQSSWDFGRSRFYAMTSAGIYTLALSSSRNDISSNLIDSRKVAASYALARAGTDLFALSDGEILRLKGSRAETFAQVPNASALAWDARRRELWCIPSDSGRIEVICTDFNSGRYTLALPAIADRTVSLNSATFVASPTRTFRLGRDAPFNTRPVEWAAESDLNKPVSGRIKLHTDLAGEVEKIDISLCRMYHNRLPPTADKKVTIRGKLGAPFRISTFLPPCFQLRTSFAGDVKSSFIFNSLSWKK